MPERPNVGEPLREALLQSIIETAPDGIITIDEQGTITSFSPAAEAIFGYMAHEVLGWNVHILMPTPHRQRHNQYMRNYIETGHAKIIGIGRVVSGRHKDGHVFPMELSVGEVRQHGRRFFTGFVRDVTQRQRAEQRVLELQAELLHVSRLSAMGEMASALAHELNQPLTAMVNYVQAGRRIAARDNDMSRLDEVMQKVANQAKRAGDIIHRLREFIKKGESDRRLEALNPVVEEATHLALVGTADLAIEVTMDLARNLPSVMIDKVQIQQVVLNLVRNAVDAMTEHEPRRLLIHTRVDDADNVLLTVADSGPGLDADVANQLFKPFVTTKPHGMGIGLSISHSIVTAHGGRIEAHPNPSGGTVFTVRLSICSDDEADHG